MQFGNRFVSRRLTCQTPHCFRIRPHWADHCKRHRREDEEARAPKPKTERAATHAGHCQACGRIQKLPQGVLAKHGYTVEHGFFSGICRGSGEVPYEESCALIERFVAAARESLATLRADQAKLRKPATENSTMIREYIPAHDRVRGRYVWSRKELTVTTDQSGNSVTYIGYDFHGRKDAVVQLSRVEHSVEFYELQRAGDVLALCTYFNQKYANSFEMYATNLQDYIEWQARRVKEWKLAPLLPLTHKDKEGFKLAEEQ